MANVLFANLFGNNLEVDRLSGLIFRIIPLIYLSMNYDLLTADKTDVKTKMIKVD